MGHIHNNNNATPFIAVLLLCVNTATFFQKALPRTWGVANFVVLAHASAESERRRAEVEQANSEKESAQAEAMRMQKQKVLSIPGRKRRARRVSLE